MTISALMRSMGAKAVPAHLAVYSEENGPAAPGRAPGKPQGSRHLVALSADFPARLGFQFLLRALPDVLDDVASTAKRSGNLGERGDVEAGEVAETLSPGRLRMQGRRDDDVSGVTRLSAAIEIVDEQIPEPPRAAEDVRRRIPSWHPHCDRIAQRYKTKVARCPESTIRPTVRQSRAGASPARPARAGAGRLAAKCLSRGTVTRP